MFIRRPPSKSNQPATTAVTTPYPVQLLVCFPQVASSTAFVVVAVVLVLSSTFLAGALRVFGLSAPVDNVLVVVVTSLFVPIGLVPATTEDFGCPCFFCSTFSDLAAGDSGLGLMTVAGLLVFELNVVTFVVVVCSCVPAGLMTDDASSLWPLENRVAVQLSTSLAYLA